MGPKEKIAVLHFTPLLGEVKKNLNKIYKLSKKAFDLGAALIVGPELATSGFSFPTPDSIRPYARSKNSSDFDKLKNLAKEKDGHIIFGYPELDDGVLYNSVLVIGPGGIEVSHKQRLSKFFGWLEAGGKEDTLVESKVGKTGVLVCPEVAVPGFVQRLKENGAELIAVPMNWYPEGDLLSKWIEIAKKNDVALVLANRFGKEPAIDFNSSISAIIDSKGCIRAFTQELTETILEGFIN